MWKILGRRRRKAHPYPWAVPKRLILGRVQQIFSQSVQSSVVPQKDSHKYFCMALCFYQIFGVALNLEFEHLICLFGKTGSLDWTKLSRTLNLTQPAITCTKLTIKTLEQGVKYAQCRLSSALIADFKEIHTVNFLCFFLSLFFIF